MLAITSVIGNPKRVTELVKKNKIKKKRKKAGRQYRPDKRPIQFH